MPAPHLDSRSHCPAVNQENHGPEVDVWSVGMLIKEISRSIRSIPPDLCVFANALQSNSWTVTQVLERLKTLRPARGLGLQDL